MKKYTTPVVSVIVIESTDIITASGIGKTGAQQTIGTLEVKF